MAGTYTERGQSPAGENNPCYMTDLTGVPKAGYWNTCILGEFPAYSGTPVAGANVLANCTGYAQGRILESFCEITGYNPSETNTHPFVMLNGNALEWFETAQAAGLELSTTPTNGSIICWGPGTDPDSAFGHVGFVENVIDENTIITTESGWGGIAGQDWIRQTRVFNGSNWIGDVATMGGYTFQGFIVNPADPDTPYPPTPPKPKQEKKKKSKWIYLMKNRRLY